MKQERKTRELRYIGVDVHRHYITIGRMNEEQEIVLKPGMWRWNGSSRGQHSLTTSRSQIHSIIGECGAWPTHPAQLNSR